MKTFVGGEGCSRLGLMVACLAMGFPAAMLAQQAPDPAVAEQLQLGREARLAGKYKDALDAFKRCIKLTKDSFADCQMGLASTYLQMGYPENSVASSDKALALAHDDMTKAVSHVLKGNALLLLDVGDKKSFEKAESEYRAATQLEPGVAAFHLNLAVSLIKQVRDDEAKEEIAKCLTLHPEAGVAEHARVLMEHPRWGREVRAPEFRLTTLQGQDLSLKQLNGKVVVLDFWATWCPPCRASVGELKELTKKYSSDQVVLISVSVDEDEKAWLDFTGKKSMTWPQYRDVDRHMVKAFEVNSFPTYLVIDGEGSIKQRIAGLNPQESVVYRLKTSLDELPQLKK